ncbi:patatin-like phospholipase family protein [Kitasatospora sp. HPMI-4]|uniref:patatin-like phospholipase family protein n=1 Tax=Kitasatospora sp. HPMI-4 TaxID=3448443 RepID=UPI003F1C20FE
MAKVTDGDDARGAARLPDTGAATAYPPAGAYRRAVVLGAGGVVGIAWMAGLADGLRAAGVDLAEAELTVGTSAGAVVGTLLATGQDPARLATPLRPDDPGARPTRVDGRRMGEVFAVLGGAEADPTGARCHAGRIALAADTGPEEAHLARMGALAGASQWPDRRLLITATDTATGEQKVFDRAGGAPLVPAVAASTAFPAVYPPITVGDRRYMDGSLHSGTNAGLARGARALVVIEPLAHMFPREPLARELAEAGAEAVVTIGPDQETIRVFGHDQHDRTAWEPAYRAGLRQAAEQARRVGAVWQESPAPIG